MAPALRMTRLIKEKLQIFLQKSEGSILGSTNMFSHRPFFDSCNFYTSEVLASRQFQLYEYLYAEAYVGAIELSNVFPLCRSSFFL